MRCLIIAERFNVKWRWPRAEQLIADGRIKTWVRHSLGVGCYGTGMTERTQSKSIGRRQLKRLGLFAEPHEWAGLNMLPPAHLGEWDEAQALLVAAHVPLSDYDRVFLVGRRVATALGYRGEIISHEGNLFLIPRPSGRSRWWNYGDIEEARERVQEFLCEPEAFHNATA